MPSEASIAFLSLWLLVTALFLYSAYWALSIRQVLLATLYRRQALWVGGMGIYFVVLSTFLTIALSFNLNALSVNILGGSIISFGFVLIFLWVDSTVRIARRSDPLFRDTLRWSKLRYWLGFVTVGGAVGALFDSLSSGFSTVAPFGGILFIGAIALYLSAKRSGDMTLRTHLGWTALCVFLLWLGSQLSQPLSKAISDSLVVQSLTYPVVAIGAYCLYRSAKSLVPLGHLRMQDADTAVVPTSSLTRS